MRIAILTLPLHTNYGGILQAYALQTILERNGHKVDILQKVPKKESNKVVGLLKKIKAFPSTYITKRYINRFIHKYTHLRKIRTLKDVKPTDYDAIVVGSDQIWRADYFRGAWKAPVKDAFLDFTRDWSIKRLAYAASFGTDNLAEYSEKEILECGKALQRFDAVTFREDSGKEICQDYFGISGRHVLDPTLLLTKEDYTILLQAARVPKSIGNLFCCILDPTPSKRELINKVAYDKHLTPFNGIVKPSKVKMFPSIESWLGGYMDAELVITDSFHACVFSIIFGKPFIAIGNSGRGMTRFTSLLKLFNLEKNLVSENSRTYPEEIGVADMKTLERYRLDSLSFFNL